MHTSTLGILGGDRVRVSPFPQEAPDIGPDEIEAVTAVLRERCLSIFSSRQVTKFESAFADYTGTKFAIAVTSGTAALHASLIACGIQPGDEVLVPVYTHMSTVNAILMSGATPVFVDIDPATFNIDLERVEEAVTCRSKAIVLVDLFGLPVDRESAMHLGERNGLRIVEDCAQSTGATFQGKKVGSFGIGCHSFGEIKNVTSAEGGMITTNDPDVARLAALVRHEGEMWIETGLSVIGSMPSSYTGMIYGIDYPIVGHNYRMNALQAAIGIVQLSKLDRLNLERVAAADYYREALRESPAFVLPSNGAASSHVYNRFVLRLSTEELGITRDGFLAALICEGIPAGVYYPVPLNRHTVIRQKSIESARHPFPAAEQVCREQIVLPSYPGLSPQDCRDVVRAVEKIVDAVQATPDIIPVIEQTAQAMEATYFGQFFSALV